MGEEIVSPPNVLEDGNNGDPSFDVRPNVERWKRQLLDVSGRNRLLYYRDSRRTVTLHCAEPDAWSALVEHDGVRLNADTLVGASAGSGVAPDQAIETGRQRIRQLADVNRTFMEEQGVHVLHACVGWLTWVDETRPPGPSDKVVQLPNGRRARLVHSPLIFVPVRVDQSGGDLRVVREPNAPIEPNITLIHLMEQQFGLKVAIDEDDELTPTAMLAAWNSAIAGKHHWQTSTEDVTRIDTFSFKKIALLREMERLANRIAEQPVLRALCGDAEPLRAASSIPDIRSLDQEVSPADVALVVPADSSQLRAVLAVKHGASIVIQGPPGTGKSQTITNLIADSIASGKRVLFVAEKRAARDVVVRNLEEAGLGEVVLHITEEVSGARRAAGAKRDIADQIGVVLQQGPGEYTTDMKAPERVSSIRAELNEYVQRLHAPLGPAAWSTPYRLLARWATVDEALLMPDAPEIPSIRDIDEAWLERVLEVAASIDDLGEHALGSIPPAWLSMAVVDWDPVRGATVTRAVDVLAGAGGRLEEILAGSALPSTSPTDTLASLRLLAVTLRDLDTYRRLSGAWYRRLVPRYWHAHQVAQRWLSHGGAPPDGNEAEKASALEELVESLELAREEVRRWHPAFPAREDTDSVDRLAEAARPLACSPETLELAVRVRARLARGAQDGVEDALRYLVAMRPSGSSVQDLLDALFRYRWAVEAVNSHPALKVESPTRERLRQRFAEADAALHRYGVASVLNAVAPKRPGMDGIAPRESELGVLRQQVRAKRRRPLRWLFTHAATAILELKPCIVTSPLGVAQFLHHEAYEFDLVLFDEASQIPTADAVVPMARARQVVVVGDSQQMPPTSFFDRTLDAAGADDDDDPTATLFESILDECETLLPTRRLLWHYRSRDERLIAFSNHLFYDGSLLTFPSSWSEHPARGVHFVYVERAVYGRGGSRTNPQEAERVIDVLEKELERDPDQQVAITAMSVAQGREVQSRIEARAVTSPALQQWLDEGGRVKNLETIQGDECDAMILSLGYGKDAGGHAVLNFGPLSRDDGYRRLNVAVTRARHKTILVASLRASDIPTTVGAGGQLVRQYLDYAERGPIALVEDLRASGVDQFDSVFEEEVARQLRARGWDVDTQVGVSRFRIDLAVRDPEQPGRYLAGIECDGATYHASESARDRDINRQRVLERLGWTIYRIWSPDWFADRQRVINDLDAFLRARFGAEGPSAVQRSGTTARPPTGPAITFKASDPALPPGTVPYTPHVPTRPTVELPRWVGRIVEAEGPMHEDELMQALRDDLGYGRLGVNIRAEFERAIRRAEQRGTIVRRGAWAWPPSLQAASVPVRVRNGGARRRFEWYPDEELLQAMRIARGISGSVTLDGLIEATARLLGVNVTQFVRERLEALAPLVVDRDHDPDSQHGPGTGES